ncbi:MAG: hypothetical protein JWR90_982 [Marmoricola sp.]|jgi:hypothetical protein|nr:hypothetical protein [Marmoricola sp.]
MTEMTTERAVAETVAAMVRHYDSGDVLDGLVRNCVALYPAAAVAVLIDDGRRGLEMLSTSSHRAEELELLQIQHDRGPCVESMRTATMVSAAGEQISDRWGVVGEAILAAGYVAVHAYPMHWRGHVLGGLNVFLSPGTEPREDAHTLGHLFADLATMAVTHSADLPEGVVAARVHEAISARSMVEQAKGVLAYRENVGFAEAHQLLRELAEQRGVTLSETAHHVLQQAQRATESW